MKDLLITRARLVNEGEISECDIRIRKGRIETIAASLSARPRENVLDAAGRTIIPGMIDDQVHFREPGMPEKADIHHESRAAVAGGVTSIMDMPNTKPPALTRARLEDKFSRASRSSLTNYSFYLGASHDNLDEIRRLDPRQVCGIKVFMGASTGNMLVDDPQTLEAIFAEAPTLIASHCEDTPTILANEQHFRERYGENVPFSAHPLIRSTEACYRSSSLAVSLAKRLGTNLHVLHISTAREMELFEAGPVRNKHITAEVCVHFLHFTDADYPRLGALIKCNPAIKTAADRDALIQGLITNHLDIIGTDHAPHTWEEKQHSYFQAPSGLPLVQHALLVLLDLYHQGRLDLPTIVNKTSHAVAERYHIIDRGFVREGYWADLVLVDLDRPTPVESEKLFSKCGWSLFTGHTFGAHINVTLINGTPVWIDGKLNDEFRGQRLLFDR